MENLSISEQEPEKAVSQVLPKNVPYTSVLSAKGEKYLRGWAKVDATYDPKGAAIRAAHFRSEISGVRI